MRQLTSKYCKKVSAGLGPLASTVTHSEDGRWVCKCHCEPEQLACECFCENPEHKAFYEESDDTWLWRLLTSLAHALRGLLHFI